MGITGLLPLLKSIHRQTELKKFSGETLAIDAYGWLHRGAVSCAVELAQGKPTRKYIDFAMHRVRMVKYFGVTPYLVFDGDFLPSKAMTESSRANRRLQSRNAGLELLKAGKPSQAHNELQKAIDVTPEMARGLIEELKKMGVPYVVAPYEADAQMVYLERHGFVSGIISEDSDLLVFGAKRLLTKLDQHGQCIEINRRDFCACREISLTGWTDQEFRHMAILSGCDYLEGVGNMGLKTAYRMVRKHKTPERVIRMIQFDGKFKVSENYLAAFKQAELTFLHQRVFCPTKQELVLLAEPDSEVDVEEMPFIGAKVDRKLAQAIAVGDVNPISKAFIVVPPAPASGIGKGGKVATSSTLSQAQPATKPIDTYFRGPRRIPMGEMDPNCFTVDPGQVATLTQNGLTPRVFPLPRPYLDASNPSLSVTRAGTYGHNTGRRRTEPIGNLSGPDESLSLANRRKTVAASIRDADNTRRAGQPLPPRPLKKARLCEDGGSYGEQSKFFPAKKTKPAKVPNPEVILRSDDSVAEALLELPDVGGWMSAESSTLSQPLEVFQEETKTLARLLCHAPNIAQHDTAASRSNNEVPGASPREHKRISDANRALHMPTQLSLSQFSYKQDILRNGTRTVNDPPTPVSSTPGSAPKSIKPLATPSMLTPLQRIGAQALGRRTDSSTRTYGSANNTVKNMSPTPGQRRRSTEKPARLANPCFIPLPRVDPDEVQALNQGSEDQLIPDSDEENDHHSLEGRGSSNGLGCIAAPNLDLSRFLYTRNRAPS